MSKMWAPIAKKILPVSFLIIVFLKYWRVEIKLRYCVYMVVYIPGF